MTKPHIEYYLDRTVKAEGKLKDGKLDGYWKWYRKDGSKLKTGYFIDGKLAKDWMNYDKNGKLKKNTSKKYRSSRKNKNSHRK